MLPAVLCCLAILFICAVRPAERRRHRLLGEDFERTVLLFQLKTVRDYYDECRGLSYREIARKYDVDAAYKTLPIKRRPAR